MKRMLPIIVSVLCALVIVLDGFLPEVGLAPVRSTLVEGALILGSFALLLGVLNLLATHGQRVIKKEQGRPVLSAVLILACLVTLAVGVLLGPLSTASIWIMSYIYEPVQSTLAALLAFMLVSALFRTSSLRTPQATVMIVAALLMLLWQLPLVDSLTPQLASAREWFVQLPLASIVRGAMIGTALGALVTALRLLLAIDRPYLGE